MEEMEIIVNRYAELYNKFNYLGVFPAMPENWREMTAEQILEFVEKAEWLVSVAQQFAETMRDLYDAVDAPYGAKRQTVYTLSEYIEQGFSEEEAPKAQRYDTLWNKRVKSLATANEVAEMDSIADELGL